MRYTLDGLLSRFGEGRAHASARAWDFRIQVRPSWKGGESRVLMVTVTREMGQNKWWHQGLQGMTLLLGILQWGDYAFTVEGCGPNPSLPAPRQQCKGTCGQQLTVPRDWSCLVTEALPSTSDLLRNYKYIQCTAYRCHGNGGGGAWPKAGNLAS